MAKALEGVEPSDELLDYLPYAVLGVDADGRIVLTNRAVEEVFGYAPEYLLGKPVEVLVPDGYGGAHAAERAAYLADPTRRPMTSRPALKARRADGSEFRVDIELTPIDHIAGIRVLACVADCTERIRREEDLRETEARLRDAQRLAMLGFWDWDILTGDLHWSDEIYRIFDITPQDFGASYPGFLATVHPEDRAEVESAVAAAIAGEAEYRIDHRIVRPSGEIRHVHEQGHVNRSADGTPVRMVGMVADITDRKALERQLIRAQRMESFARLAGGVAHDFNNVLTAVSTYAALIGRTLQRHGLDTADTEEIGHAAARAATLTARLLAFSRRSVVEPKLVSLSEVVLDVDRMLRRVVGEDVEVVTIPTDDPWRTVADPSQLEQVLLNLAVNARDAMPEGGTLTIETRNEPGSPGADDRVSFTVTDTGTGMSEEARARAFDPFFTTKGEGPGTGLGLATCLAIVHDLNGTLEIDSEVGKGTTVRCILPRAEEVGADPGARTEVRGGTETVLLAEDDSSVRTVTARLLLAYGYHVLTAGTGDEALEVEAAYDGPIHLLLTDIIMPRTGGWALATRVRERRPRTPVLFMSGYPGSDFQERRGLGDWGRVLSKPFLPRTLLSQVRDLLDVSDATRSTP